MSLGDVNRAALSVGQRTHTPTTRRAFIRRRKISMISTERRKRAHTGAGRMASAAALNGTGKERSDAQCPAVNERICRDSFIRSRATLSIARRRCGPIGGRRRRSSSSSSSIGSSCSCLSVITATLTASRLHTTGHSGNDGPASSRPIKRRSIKS